MIAEKILAAFLRRWPEVSVLILPAKEDALQEIRLSIIEANGDEKQAFLISYRRIWKLFEGLYNRPAEIPWLREQEPSFSEKDFLFADKFIRAYQKMTFAELCASFRIEPTRELQKMLARYWGKEEGTKPRGKRIRVEVSEDTDLSFLPRTSAWRARKNGFFTILKEK